MSPNPSGPSSTPSTPSMPSTVRPLRDLPSIPPSARVQAPPKPQDPFLSIMRSLKPESMPKTTVPLGAADTNSGTPLATPNPRPPTANSSTVGSTSSGEDFPKIKCNIGGTPCRPVGVLDDGTPVPGNG
ncbi:hypothetical protein A0H81_09800 [Grifola frondosa]|uniref:Uncharacterized protein n=1 Tax=Grifola frondosa TaxID=5627 RepID=A0A1C7M0T8_GRIFR|nr:hypothetical protein A0H81_09800 [Grifola frondosa]